MKSSSATSIARPHPCTDFFEYANGRWRAGTRFRLRCRAGAGAGPPARRPRISCARSSTRPRRAERPTGSIEQLIGDFYAACMNEQLRNQLGAKPLARTMAQIEAIAAPAACRRRSGVPWDGIARAVRRQRRHRSAQSAQTSSRSSAPAGLGLPDRDYYLEDRAAIRGGARQIPRSCARSCSCSQASDRARRSSGGDRHARSRRSSPRRRSTTSRCATRSRRSQDDVRRAADAGAALRLGATSRARDLPQVDLNVDRAEVPAGGRSRS